MLEFILSLTVISLVVSTTNVNDLLGSPHQHDHLEAAFLESDFEDRFPVLSELLREPYSELRRYYGNSDNKDKGEIWNDPACPTFLVNEDLTICGNLVVRGRLTIVTAANTSVFEDFVEYDQSNNIKTNKLSVFARERCTRSGSITGSTPSVCFGEGGSIFVPAASLLVSGHVTVMGSIFATSVTMDSASSLASGIGSFLGLTGLPTPASDASSSGANANPLRFGKSRSRRTAQNHFPDGHNSIPVPPLSILPPHPSRDDFLCEHRAAKLPEALFMPRGMLFMRNNAALFTFGRSVFRTVGLDKGSMWLSRCSSVLIADEDGNKGDMALLAGSSAFISGENSVLLVANLAVMDGSTVGLQGTLDAKELVKVTTGGALTIGGSLQAFDVAVADAGTLSVIRSSLVKDLVMLSGGDMLFGHALEVLSVEVYDNGKLYVNKALTILEYLVADDGAEVICLEGNVNMGALLLSNYSSITMQGFHSTLTVGEDVKAKNGAVVTAPAVNVGCSVILDQHSSVEISGELRIRSHDFSTPRHPLILPNVTESTPMACLREQPVLMVRKSDLKSADGVTLGGRRVFADEPSDTKNPMIAIVSQSSIAVGSWKAHDAKHALVIKGQSKFDFARNPGSAQSVFIPGKMVTLEGGSLLRVVGVDIVRMGLLELSQTSRVLLETGLLEADWILLTGRSTMEVMSNTDFRLAKGMDVSDHSLVDMEGSYKAGPSFDHVLAQGGSVVRWGGRCATRSDLGLIELGGEHVAQDRSELFFDGSIATDVARQTTITVETHSIARFHCVIDAHYAEHIKFRQTPEAQILASTSAGLPIQPVTYLLKVPPTDAASLKAFTRDSATHQAMQRKSLFWESWQKALDYEKERAQSMPSADNRPWQAPTTPLERPGGNEPGLDAGDGEVQTRAKRLPRRSTRRDL